MTQASATLNEDKPDFLSRPLLATLSLDWEKAIYVAFILAAIVTRFWDLGGRVMSHDESLHTQFSYQFYNGDGYNHTPLMHGPFLFHITAVSYWLFGVSDLSARIPVALFGIILVAMPYLLRRWLGRIGALFTSFFFLISPYITYYSRYIRHDIYVIVWALIVFIAIWFYLERRDEKYLWWLAAGTALMFSTKEVGFIYVAIFGSFLILRLLTQINASKWFRHTLPKLRTSLFLMLAGLVLISGGLLGQLSASKAETTPEAETATEGFAADPSQDLPITEEAQTGGDGLMRWVQFAGIGVLSVGVFLAIRRMRPHLDEYPEFDLIVLFTTLVLPLVSPLLTTIAGWNPRDYTLSHCVLEGQESMTSLQLLLARAGNGICWSSFLSSGVVRSGMFLLLTLAVAVLVGLWWDRRRWLVAAAIFHAIFAVFYTSVFTNPGGWTSGMVGSLGYWLEQQAVERGSQPWYYYFFVMPIYEFLPLIFSLIAVRFWLIRQKLNKVVGYWLTLLIVSWLLFSLSNWFYNRSAALAGGPQSSALGIILGLLLFGAGILYWFLAFRQQLTGQYALKNGLRQLFDAKSLTGFVPWLIWWLLLTFIIYSYAGEKMPWLSTHFVIPMAFLAGWYFNEKLDEQGSQFMLSRGGLLLTGLTIILIVVAVLALGPLLLGKIQFGNQDLNNLRSIGRLLGGLAAASAIYYFWRLRYLKSESSSRSLATIFAVFVVLSLLTIRFSAMASFPNADYANEFLVYAHGAPATKHIVMEQVEELSMRLYGDKSIKVAFGQDTSWPFTWYLHDYPNRVFFGDKPNHSLTESPVVIAGSLDWAATEPYLGNDYEQYTYTYLWWPMEEYRKFSWNALLGDPNAVERRGLANPGVRQALWDIFFYRDYERYGQVFGGTYTPSQWPLRHEMRLYIRRDVLANLWDYGIGAVRAEPLQDPYAENAMQLQPVMVINEAGIGGVGEGEFLAPRNVAVGPDGRIYVADSGNHRVQVFEADGTFVRAWGQSGTEPGQFNEPWSILVDEANVYVADTWNHRIQKFTLDGELVGVFGHSGSPTEEGDGSLGLFFGPRDIVPLGFDQLLVTDTGNHRLQLLDRNGNFIRQIGEFGNQLGQFNEPVGLAASPDGTVFLADTWNSRIQQFSPDLFAINEWEVDAWDGQSTNNKPYMAADSAGRLYVTDPEGYRVLIFSNLGDYLGRFGTFGTDVNSFGLPNGIAIDAQDNIYIADAGNNRILKFAPIFSSSQTQTQGEDGGAVEEGDAAPAEELPAGEDGNGSAGDSPAVDDAPSPTIPAGADEGG